MELGQRSVNVLANVLRLAGQNNTEATSTSTSAGDRLSVSGLSIPTSSLVLITFRFRKTTGAATTAAFGLKINSTIVMEALTGTAPNTSGANAAEVGLVVVLILPRATNYTTSSAIGWYTVEAAANTAIAPERTAAIPNATITDIAVRGISGDAAITHGVDELRVFTFPVLRG